MMDDLISRKDVITAVETAGGNYLMALETISSTPTAAAVLRLTARIAQLEADKVLTNGVWSANLRLIAERDKLRAALDTAEAEKARAAEWQAMPPPNDVDILVLRSTGALQYIEADDNDYTWHPEAYYSDAGPEVDWPVAWMFAAALRTGAKP